MKMAPKPRRPAAGRRRAGKQTAARRAAAQFFQRTFYYLKAEQFIKAATRLLCEAA